MQCIPANMADEGPNRRRRYKEYMRHHNPYKFEAARRSRRRLGCRKPDPNSNSGNNRSDPESKIREVFNCDVNSSVHVRDKCSSESAAITTNQLPRDEQMKEILETRDFGFEEVLDGGLSEDDLSNNGPFHLISTPPLWMKLSEGVTKVISEGVSQSASFDLAIFSEGTAQNDPFFLGEIENKAYF